MRKKDRQSVRKLVKDDAKRSASDYGEEKAKLEACITEMKAPGLCSTIGAAMDMASEEKR